MIGNKIEFVRGNFDINAIAHERNRTQEDQLMVGLVVDAYTEITGTISGKSEAALGFGTGNTTGETKSQRKYKVMYNDKITGTKKFYDMNDWQLIKIISFAGQPTIIDQENIKADDKF